MVLILILLLPFRLDQLFSTSSGATISYRVYSKSGHPFALLPDDALTHRLFVKRLPAHSVKAKGMREALTWWNRLHLPRIFGERVALPMDPQNPLTQFLASLSRCPIENKNAPVFLLGNPLGEAPRLIAICRDMQGRPTAVAKIGTSSAACRWIQKESDFLQSVSIPHHASIPRWLGFQEKNEREWMAFGMEYIEGSSADPVMTSDFHRLLHSWVDDQTTCAVNRLPLWDQLCKALYIAQLELPDTLKALAGRCIHPTLYHGDFAPWNILKDGEGCVKVIDWERGELRGLPGWDWLHFEIQVAILLKKWPAAQVRAHGQRVVQSHEFLDYVARTFPTTTTRELPEVAGSILDGYFLYNWYVLLNREKRSGEQEVN